MRLITPTPEDEHLALRLVTALVQEWDRLPERVRIDILREATFVADLDLSRATTGLEYQIETFIRRHQEARDA